MEIDKIPIIAICHLSWDWVWQRPQQFISRLAQTREVLFVETLCAEIGETATRIRTAPNHPNVTIVEMKMPTGQWSDTAFIDAERRRVLQQLLATEFRGHFDLCILWVYDPMTTNAFVGHLNERIVVYDCMDELSQFQGAPTALVAREQELTKRADVIFCGGRRMTEKRLPLNRNTHFYGTGVDCLHFGRAITSEFAVDPEIAEMPGKVLGYFGVVDERIDYDLLARLADSDPSFTIVMIGPTAKIDPAALPQRTNIRWLGGRPYLRLPAMAKGFAVSLMPFALNAATEYINPTKALEYMATGRPLVSTALAEVQSNFSSVARIARSHDEFIKMCREEVETPTHSRIQKGLALASANTWEAIVAEMEGHIAATLSDKTTNVGNRSPRKASSKAEGAYV